LSLAPFSNVPSDLGKSDEFATVIYWIDDHVSPEALAVLADAPTFLFESALPGRGFQRLVGFAVFSILLGIEPREMLANDFFGPVALDPLGAGVPRGHPSVRFEQKIE
jgi:hypothetical protein